MSDELPDGWAATTLGELGEWRGGGTPSKAQVAFWTNGSIPWVSPKDMKRDIIDDAEDHITEAAIKGSATQLIPAHSVLIVTRSGILRHTLPVSINLRSVAINQDLKAVTPVDGIKAEFVARQLHSDAQGILSDCAKSGTTVDSVDFDKLKARSFRLAPLSEQRRIVAKIDSLFARSSKARDELARIPRLIERYKQAVLEAAFRGDLTADWRAENRSVAASIASRVQIDGRAAELTDLPDGWTWHSVGDVADISGGLTKNQKRHSLPVKMPYLRVANVYANELRLSEIEEIGVSPEEAKKIRLQAGDLLIVEGNGSLDQIGRVALWNNEISDCGHQNHLIRARPLLGVISKFVLFWLLSPQGREAIQSVASSSSGLHTLSITKVAGLPFPYCSAGEMVVVVERIEAQLSALAVVISEFQHATGLVDRLDQSILDKAFSGKLVPQDPADEPASELLKRIQAARSAAPKVKRGRRGKA